MLSRSSLALIAIAGLGGSPFRNAITSAAARDRRKPNQPPKVEHYAPSSNAEIAAWNREVDRKKAEKHRAKLAKHDAAFHQANLKAEIDLQFATHGYTEERRPGIKKLILQHMQTGLSFEKAMPAAKAAWQDWYAKGGHRADVS